MRIVIVDYGMGNIKSIFSTLLYLGVDGIILSDKEEDFIQADKIILPGVGSFAKAMENIKNKNIDLILENEVIKKKKPLLGICLGMQLLGRSSTEDGFTKGLGYIDAEVTKFEDINMKIPHVGFNQVVINPNSNLYKGIATNPDFYFTHSYKMISDKNINTSLCNYSCDFVASFEYQNILGVQFHPELSQKNGLKLLENFIYNF